MTRIGSGSGGRAGIFHRGGEGGGVVGVTIGIVYGHPLTKPQQLVELSVADFYYV